MRTRAQVRQRAALEAGIIILAVHSMLEEDATWDEPFTINAYELAEELHTTHRTLMRALSRLAHRGQIVYDATPSHGTTLWLLPAVRDWAEVLLGWQD